MTGHVTTFLKTAKVHFACDQYGKARYTIAVGVKQIWTLTIYFFFFILGPKIFSKTPPPSPADFLAQKQATAAPGKWPILLLFVTLVELNQLIGGVFFKYPTNRKRFIWITLKYGISIRNNYTGWGLTRLSFVRNCTVSQIRLINIKDEL